MSVTAAVPIRDEFLPIYEGTTSLAGIGSGVVVRRRTASRCTGRSRSPRRRTRSPPAWRSRPRRNCVPIRWSRGGLLTETGDLPAEVVDLATSITASATTPFDKANALNSYFTDPANGFTYSLNVPAGNSGDPLVDFLTLKQGYCEQYASAMAHHAARRRRAGPGRDRLHPGHPDRRRQLPDQQQRRPRLGGGAVRLGRLGAVRSHSAGRRPGRAAGLHRHGRRRRRAPRSVSARSRRRAPATTFRAEEPVPQAGPTAGTAATGTAADEPVIPTGLWWVLGFLVLVVAARQRPDRGPSATTATSAGHRRCRRPWRRGSGLAGDRGPCGRPWRGAQPGGVGAIHRQPPGQGGPPHRTGTAGTTGRGGRGRTRLVQRRQ